MDSGISRSVPVPVFGKGSVGGVVAPDDGNPEDREVIITAGQLKYYMALEAVADCVPDLLKWMERHKGGDETLDPEEYYIETEHAQRLLARLEKVHG